VHCQKPAVTDAFEDTKVPNIVPSSPRIVLIGGTGRVGSSTASALLHTIPDSKLILGSRTVQSYKNAIERRPNLINSSHVLLDVNQPSTIEKAIEGADLVVHTAGPFQRRGKCAVLEAAIKKEVPYVDVCDDTEYSKEAKRLHLKAMEAGVPAIITGGIYPGLSNVMAAHMIETANETNDGDMSRESEPKAAPSRVLYSYFTAGSGGAGPTILETTFLLAGEPVVAYKCVLFDSHCIISTQLFCIVMRLCG
jgi:saccharopine dehydrogenase-like NADP-dependent oxidoreductase